MFGDRLQACHMARTEASWMTETSKVALAGIQPVFSCSAFSRSGVCR